MGSLLTRVKFPTLVRISTSEMSRVSDTLAAGFSDMLQRLFASADATPVDGVVEGMVCGYDGAWRSYVMPGLAARYSSAGLSLTGDDLYRDSAYRLMSLRDLVTVTHAAADPANPRIDRIVITDGEADARQTSVGIWDTITKTFSPTNKYLERRNTPTVAIVTGTPAAVPAAPAAPAGYLSLYTVLVPAAAPSMATATYTDVRTLRRGPGKLWADLVKIAGDTMTGNLTLPRLIWSGSGARIIAQLGSTAGRGLYADDSVPATPLYELRSSAGTPAGVEFKAGTVQAVDGSLRMETTGGVTAQIKSDFSAAYIIKAMTGVSTAFVRFTSGAFFPDDKIPAAPTLAEVPALYKDLIPWSMGQFTAGNPPLLVGTAWNSGSTAYLRAGTGQYVFPFLNAAPAGSTMIASATLTTSGDHHVAAYATTAGMTVEVRDGTGALVNTVVNFVAHVYAIRLP